MKKIKTKQFSQLLRLSTLILAVVYTNLSYSEIRPHKTSRLVSTAGTGVGSILLEESSVLNPASVAFFNNSALYYQQSKLSNSTENNEISDSFSVIASDGKGSMKGTFGYHKNKIIQDTQERISVSAASPGGKSSSVGVNFSQYKIVTFTDGIAEEKKYRTMDIGVTHIVSPELSFGIVIQDPTKSDQQRQDLAIIGFHYHFHQYIALMGDLATVYRGTNVNEKYLYRGGIQLTFLSDFYVRGGISRDLTDGEERTTGLGLSWVQPKLTFDLAFEDVETNSSTNEQEAVTLREASFSVSYRF